MTTDSDIDRQAGQEIWQNQVDLLLAMQVKIGATITYQQLANEADVTPPHRIHKLTSYLEMLIKQDVADGHFIRASLVISKIRGLPAPGFFIKLRELGFEINDEARWHSHYIKSALNPSLQ